MAPMKSSREMAVASRTTDTTRKRFASDSDIDIDDGDSDSGSDFYASKTAKKRSNPKKPRASAGDSSKISNVTSTTTTAINLPKEMACPEGVTPFSKAHWTAILKTDEFWAYFDRFASPYLKKRLSINLNFKLNSDAQSRKETRETKELVKTTFVKPSAIKSGPIYHKFDAEPESVSKSTGSPVQSNDVDAGIIKPPLEVLLKRIAEQGSILASFEAKKAENDNDTQKNGEEVTAGKVVDDDGGKDDKKEDDKNVQVNGREGERNEEEGGNSATMMPVAEVDNNISEQEGSVSAEMNEEGSRWEPKGW